MNGIELPALQEWAPMPPNMGPPLPQRLGIYWPWYKAEVPLVYTCPECGATFSTQEELNAHIAAAHPTPLAYDCPYCDQSFDTYEELVAHVQSVHPGERIPLPITWE